MHYKKSLKSRITLSFFIFGVLLSIGIATVVYLAVERIETELMAEGLTTELTLFMEQPKQPLGSAEQLTNELTRYHVADSSAPVLPDYLRDLPLGYQELELGGHLYIINSAPTTKGTLYLVRNATQFEMREESLQQALILICIVAPLLALWVGSILSGQVISPVSSLAKHLSELRADTRYSPRIASKYAEDEVGQLATTFDRYMEQLEGFVAREQEFTANASHELRTPLAIINGAAELLSENSELPEKAKRQVERIVRAGNRMQQMVEVLLLLARDDTNSRVKTQPNNLAEIASEAIEHQAFLAADKPITIEQQVDPQAEIAAPRAVLAIIIANLLRNALTYTERGEVVVAGDNHALHVSDTGPGIPEHELDRIFQRNYRG